MDKDDVKKKIESEPDFINSKKYDYSLSSFMQNNRNAKHNDKLICTLLMLAPEELIYYWKGILEKGRRYFRIDVD